MTDFHPCEDCVWYDTSNQWFVSCFNPLVENYNIEKCQSKCKYFIDEDDLREMYEELGVYEGD